MRVIYDLAVSNKSLGLVIITSKLARVGGSQLVGLYEGNFTGRELQEYAEKTGPKIIDAQIMIGVLTNSEMELLGLTQRGEYAYTKMFYLQDHWVDLKAKLLAIRGAADVHDVDEIQADLEDAVAQLVFEEELDEDCIVS